MNSLVVFYDEVCLKIKKEWRKCINPFCWKEA